MHRMSYSFCTLCNRMVTLFCAFALTLLLMAVVAQAQATATDGATPSGLAPGAPAGAYALSGFENVNLFNGNLNFSLPLLKIGGRGNAQLPVTLTLNSVHWTVINENAAPGSQPFPFSSGHSPIIDATSGTSPTFAVEPDWWGGLRPGFGPGVLQARVARSMNNTVLLTRLTFTAPDGTEYELRDMQNSGKPLGIGPRDRGTVFVSADGTSVTFVSNTAIQDIYSGGDGSYIDLNGYLMMSDGTRYDITTGLVRTITDRNGNRLNFTYDDANIYQHKRRVLTITDSLGRQVTFAYDLQDGLGKYDRIKYYGFGGVERIIKVRRTTLQAALRHTRSGDSLNTKMYAGLFPTVYSEGFGSTVNDMYNPDDVVSAVELPDGRSYQLYYNEYNELARVVLPTGGAIEYDYTSPNESVVASYGYQVHRRVTERRTYGDGGVLQSKQLYLPTYTGTANGGVTAWETKVEVQQYDLVRDPDHTLTGVEKHIFHGSPVPTMFKSGLDYSEWKEGKEKQIETFAAAGNLLRVITNTWQQCVACELSLYWWTNPAQSGHTSENAPPNNPHVISALTTLKDMTPYQVSQQTFSYDRYNNLTDTYDYDYGSGAAGSLLRRTHYDYLTINPINNLDYTGTSIHIRHLPSQQWVSSDAAGNSKQALTVYEYDNYVSDSSHAPLLNRPGISGLAPTFTASYTSRGNATRVTSYANAQTASVPAAAASQYDIAGNVVKTIDTRGYATTIDYTDRFGMPDGEARANYAPPQLGGQGSYAFVTGTTNALGYVSYAQFDYSSGRAVDGEDINGTVNSSFYNDALDRQTQVVVANNRPLLRSQTTITYDDANHFVTVTGDLRAFNDNLLKSETLYDSFGRTTETRKYEGSTYSSVRQNYDGLGRAYQLSNSFRPNPGEQPVWTESVYDATGRVTSITSPDGASVTKAYSGNMTTVTDQAGRRRRGVSDALGRVFKVIEDPTGPLNYETSYMFDALGNIRLIQQDAQRRYFLYDSLGRLIRSSNPEQRPNAAFALSDPLTGNSQWANSYTYDAAGNMLTKTEARGITTTNVYDELSRILTRTYSDGTPTVTFTYDTASVSNSKGRLTSVGSPVSTYNYTGYDELGRITGSSQTTGGQTYSMSYVYDLAGNLTTETYPSGRTVTGSVDNAGRLSSVTGQQPMQPARTYASNFGYTAFGAIEHLRLGNGRWENTQFNSRQQETIVGLGASIGNSGFLKLEYDYGTAGNNGSLKQQKINVPGINNQLVQTYSYDELNRLQSATETGGSAQVWKQTFIYDRYGNRRIDAAADKTTPVLVGQNPQISTTTNRIIAQQGEQYEYDTSGNLTKDRTGNRFDYDAEGMQVRYNGGSSQGGTDYLYDGQGKRVKKIFGGIETVFVYNAVQQLVAEYQTSYQPTAARTSYVTTDPLGSPRVVTDGAGAVTSRHDYLAFGEEIGGMGGRTSQQAYVADNIRQQYTGYERDVESGLDYAQARYYSSAHGRFTSVDPLMASATIRNPQTFNRYSYALNNPYKFVDPLGLYSMIWRSVVGDYGRQEKRSQSGGQAQGAQGGQGSEQGIETITSDSDDGVAVSNETKGTLDKLTGDITNVLIEEDRKLANMQDSQDMAERVTGAFAVDVANKAEALSTVSISVGADGKASTGLTVPSAVPTETIKEVSQNIIDTRAEARAVVRETDSAITALKTKAASDIIQNESKIDAASRAQGGKPVPRNDAKVQKLVNGADGNARAIFSRARLIALNQIK